MLKTQPKHLFALAVLGLAGAAAHSAGAMSPDTVIGMLQSSMGPAVNKLAAKAITWLAIFTTIQFLITNYGQLRSDGGIDSVIAKLVGSFVWMGVCIYIINNGPKFIGGAGDEFFRIVGLDLPSPGEILKLTFSLSGTLLVTAGLAGVASPTIGNFLVFCLILVLVVGALFSFKLFMIQLELGLIVMLSPLSFSFLGLNALRDQGIAPFKALISLGYRIILVTVILSGFTHVASVAAGAIRDLHEVSFSVTGLSNIGEKFNILLSAIGAYLLLAYLLFKSDSVAASLAGGHTSMGTADVASAAAAGAAMGAAVAATGSAATAAAGNKVQSMADFMNKIAGNASVSNASSLGSGGTGLEMPPPLPPSGSSASNGMPPPGPEGYSPASNSTAGPDLDKPPVAIPDPYAKAGSGVNAGFGAAPGSSSQPQAGSKPGRTVGGSMSELGRHLSGEKAPTHISINTHHGH